jgi:hypothetical protein
MRKHLITYKDRFYLIFYNPRHILDALLKAIVDIYTQNKVLKEFKN